MRVLARLDWRAIERDLDAYGCAIAPKLISRETCRRDRGALSRRRALPLAYRDGEPRLWPRRVQIFRQSVARSDRRASPRFLPPARAHGGSVERGDGRLGPLSCANTKRSLRAVIRRVRSDRRRSSCAMALATTIACTRTCTASIFSRCRWRSCSPSPAMTSPAASSC